MGVGTLSAVGHQTGYSAAVPRKMKVLVIDEHPLFVAGIGHVLRMMHSDIEILEAFSAEDGRTCAESRRDLDLIVLDWDLPHFGGLPLLQILRQRNPAAAVVVLSADGDADVATTAIRRGAAGVIPKSAKHDLVLNALRLVMSGGVYFPAEAIAVAADLTDRAGSGSDKREFSLTERQRHKTESLGLSKRETEVLELLVAGHANKVIGQQLDIAECTVKAHITAILRALNAGSRTQAIYHVTHGCLAS